MVDKMLGKAVKGLVKDGEMKAPVKSIKLKVKFQKAKGEALEGAKK